MQIPQTFMIELADAPPCPPCRLYADGIGISDGMRVYTRDNSTAFTHHCGQVRVIQGLLEHQGTLILPGGEPHPDLGFD
jgi:hypothetical protein